MIEKFIYYFFCSSVFNEEFRSNLQGIIGGVPLSKFKELSILIPPLQEQQRIAAKLDELFALIDKIEKEQEELEEYKKLAKEKVLELAVTGKLVKQDPNDEPASVLLKRIKKEKEALIKAGKIKKDKANNESLSDDDKNYYGKLPINWSICALGDLFEVVSASRVHQSDWKSSGVPFYRAREIAKLSELGFIKNDLFISEELYKKFAINGVPEENDIMVTAVGTLGKCYVVKKTDKFYYKDASVLSLKNIFDINPNYIVSLFNSRYLIEQIKGGSFKTTVDTITIEKAKQYLIALPPINEQNRIVKSINSLFQTITDL